MTLETDYLRCEYLVCPLGIDALYPRLSWIVKSDDRGQYQTAYRIIIASNEDLLDDEKGDLWDTGKISSDQTCHIKYKGKSLKSQMYCYWQVKVWDKNDDVSEWSQKAFWSMGLIQPKDWKAKWIGLTSKKKKRPIRKMVPKARYEPSLLMRKEFKVSKKIKRAIIYASALGEYELYLNGNRVGDHILTPEWTDYNKKTQYQTYDITDLIKKNLNTIGVLLGDGWYRGRLGPAGVLHDYYGTNLRFLMQMKLELDDGNIDIILTDSNWKVFDNGPIRQSDHFRGEIYDTNKEQIGWDFSNYDDSHWSNAIIDDSINTKLVAQMNEPIRIVKQIKPIERTEPIPGVFIFNMGQNIAGWCKIRLGKSLCESKTTVKLRHGEILKEDGTLYTRNLRLVRATDKYILNNIKDRGFHPHFTYHGFQYVEVTGLKLGVIPSLDILTGCAIASDSPIVGSFECSDSTLNRLWSNILWTQRDNMISVPTDCPQRGERMGWLGDNTAFCQTGIYNMDMAAFYSKWLKDIRDAQAEDGSYPDFVPYPKSNIYNKLFNTSCCPGWADCGIILPWTLYLNYADKKILEDHFDSAKKFITYVHTRNPNLIWKKGIGSNYGDWLNSDTFKIEDFPKKGSAMPKDVYSTVYFALSTKIVSFMAKVLGKDEDYNYFKDLALNIKEKFNDSFVSDDGIVKGNNQAAYAFTLHYDLMSEDLRPKLLQNMIKALEKLDIRISTGFMTTLPLMMELVRSGNAELAYKLLFNRRVPSWFYMIDQGATTMWERWDGYVKGRGPHRSLMNSFNHFAIGSIGEWIYRIILGINLDENNPGYKHIIIKPQPGGPLTWVKGSYNSIHGKIKVEYSSFEIRKYFRK
jgi:alpha-L-rhamnosidase